MVGGTALRAALDELLRDEPGRCELQPAPGAPLRELPPALVACAGAIAGAAAPSRYACPPAAGGERDAGEQHAGERDGAASVVAKGGTWLGALLSASALEVLLEDVTGAAEHAVESERSTSGPISVCFSSSKLLGIASPP